MLSRRPSRADSDRIGPGRSQRISGPGAGPSGRPGDCNVHHCALCPATRSGPSARGRAAGSAMGRHGVAQADGDCGATVTPVHCQTIFTVCQTVRDCQPRHHWFANQGALSLAACPYSGFLALGVELQAWRLGLGPVPMTCWSWPSCPNLNLSGRIYLWRGKTSRRQRVCVWVQSHCQTARPDSDGPGTCQRQYSLQPRPGVHRLGPPAGRTGRPARTAFPGTGPSSRAASRAGRLARTHRVHRDWASGPAGPAQPKTCTLYRAGR